MIFNKIKKAFKNPSVVIELIIRKYPKLFTDKMYLSLLYRIRFGRKLNWDSPKSFNEKLSWLKVYNRNPLYTTLADKYEVKQFVANIIGEEYVVPTLAVWNSIEDVIFDNLPNSFVVKGTHDSSGAFIVKNKNDYSPNIIREKYRKIMKSNYFWSMREWPYKNIKPRMIVDTLLDDNSNDTEKVTVRDYKFCCFNGEPHHMYITIKDKDIYENYYGKNFEIININHGFRRHSPEFEKPKNYEKMWTLAQVLAKASNSPFVRVDFYNMDGKIYFGEYTFYDWGGLKPFVSFEQDLELGEIMDINNI